jgi:hypothetical protein
LVKLPDDGNTVTQNDSTVYEIGADGMRHAFPNPSVYFSRHCDFSNIHVLSSQTLARLRLGPNMTYQPGLRLVKFLSVPTTYLVQTPNILRAIPDEAAAVMIAGADWNKQVSDITDAFYLDYVIGTPVSDLTGLELAPPRCAAAQGEETPVPAPWPFADIPASFRFTSNFDDANYDPLIVRRLQEVLIALGSGIYPEARVTGNFGSATLAAVKRLQRAHGLDPIGVVGPGTRDVLNAFLDGFGK